MQAAIFNITTEVSFFHPRPEIREFRGVGVEPHSTPRYSVRVKVPVHASREGVRVPALVNPVF